MKEEWKDIRGYEGLYQVSSHGDVKSLKKGEKILKKWKRSNYFLVDLWRDGVRDVRSIHILVYEAFNGPIHEGNIVHHKDENKENNFYANLAQVSSLEHNNIHHKGHTPWNKGAKMSDECIKKQWDTKREKYGYEDRNKNILLDRNNGMSVKDISTKYGISTRYIYQILKEAANV